MTHLTVEYDPRCGLCCAIKRWVQRQPQLVPVTCVAQPDGRPSGELRVIADSGEFWSGDAAWVMVLWALADYRHWAYRLASPALLPTARTLFSTLSAYRGTLSCRFGLRAEQRADERV